MIEISVKVPKDVGDIITGTEETIYVEALHHVAFKKLSHLKEQLETYKKQTRVFEQKYHKTYEEFLQDVPDTIEGHDDWIDWSYLTNVAAELSRKVDLLSLLKG